MSSYIKKFYLKLSCFVIFTFFNHLGIVKSSYSSCKSNTNNCNKCNPMTKLCEICNYPEVYTPDIYGGCSGALKCSLGKNYCNKCDQNGQLCHLCDSGFIPDENGGCSYSPNCKVSYKGECIECNKNFFKTGKKGEYQICKSYSSEDFLHCISINYETGFCSFCEWGYFLSSENKCIKIENCQESVFGNCITCKNGFYLNKLNDTCEKKHDDFALCKQTVDNITCDICDINNYFDETGICVPNKYCAKSMNHICIECIIGYYLTPENSVCTHTENCITGDKDLGMCMKCNDTFYLDTEDYICKTNLEDNEFKYCIKVEDGNCIECQEDYYVGEDFKCSFTKYCSESELGTCIKCSQNYYLGYDNKCTDTEHCIYSSNDYCLECEDGFYFNRKNRTCYEYNNESIYNNCKYSCEFAEKCCSCKNQFYLRKNDSLCFSNLEYGPFYKCAESDEEGKYCVNCIDPYFVGIDDDLCTLVEACAKSENEFRCKECIEFYCLDVNKGICIENDKIENETYKIYFACNYTNEEGTACQQCLDGYEVGEEGYCIDVERCIERENGDGVCLKCKDEYCANDVYGCVDSHYANCIRCNNLYDLYACTQCEEGYKVNLFGGCDSEGDD